MELATDRKHHSEGRKGNGNKHGKGREEPMGTAVRGNSPSFHCILGAVWNAWWGLPYPEWLRSSGSLPELRIRVGDRRDASVGVRGTPARQVHASEASQNPGPDQSSQGHAQSNFHVNCSTPNTNHLKSKSTLKKITFKVASVYLVLVLVSANKIIIGR